MPRSTSASSRPRPSRASRVPSARRGGGRARRAGGWSSRQGAEPLAQRGARAFEGHQQRGHITQEEGEDDRAEDYGDARERLLGHRVGRHPRRLHQHRQGPVVARDEFVRGRRVGVEGEGGGRARHAIDPRHAGVVVEVEARDAERPPRARHPVGEEEEAEDEAEDAQEGRRLEPLEVFQEPSEAEETHELEHRDDADGLARQPREDVVPRHRRREVEREPGFGVPLRHRLRRSAELTLLGHKGGAEVEDHVDPEGGVDDVVDGNVRRMLRNAERQLHRQVDRVVDDEQEHQEVPVRRPDEPRRAPEVARDVVGGVLGGDDLRHAGASLPNSCTARFTVPVAAAQHNRCPTKEELRICEV